jgi:hypothetical protein
MNPDVRRAVFTQKFNTALKGKTSTNYVPQEFYDTLYSGLRNTIEASTSAKSRKPQVTASSKKEKTSSSEITQEEQQAFLRERDKERRDRKDAPWFKDAFNAVTKPLDLLARPGRAAVSLIDAPGQALLEGEPIWSVGDDALTASARALWGTNKRAGGEMVQTLRQIAEKGGENTGLGNRIGRNVLGGPFWKGVGKTSAFLHSLPKNPDGTSTTSMDFLGGRDVADLFDIGAGFTADVALDPLTYASGGSKLIAEGVETTGKAAVKALAGNVAEQATKDVGGKIPAALKSSSFSSKFGKGIDDLLDSGVPAQVAEGKRLQQLEKAALANAQKEAQIASRYERGIDTSEQFLDAMRSTAANANLGVTNKIRAVTAGKTPVDVAAKELYDARVAKIADETFNVTEKTRMAVEDALDKTIYEVQSKSGAGKVIGANGPEFARNTGQAIAEGYKNNIRNQLTNAAERFVDQFNKGRPLTVKQLEGLKRDVPMFKEWHQEFINAAKLGGGPSNIAYATNRADIAVSKKLAQESIQITETAIKMMEDKLRKVPTIKLMGQEVAQLPKLGQQLDRLKTAAGGKSIYTGFQKAFNYSSSFPGYSTLIGQKVRSVGMRKYEETRQTVAKVAQEFTAKERRELQLALEQGRPPTDPKMLEGYKFIKEAYEKIFNAEVASGARSIGSTQVNDYAYTRIKPSRRSVDVKEAVTNRKKFAKDTGTLTGHTSSDLVKQGFKVEHDAFKNLLHREMKSSRDLIRQDFYKDLVTHYGIKGKNLSKAEAKARGLVKVDGQKYKDLFSDVPLKPGESLFIDKEIDNVWANYRNLSSLGANDTKELLRTIDWVTRKFKTWNTVYAPGYHVRNMIGDMFLGHMDGVKANDYKKILEKWPRRSTAQIDIGGRTHPMDDLVNAYYDNVSSGTFFDTDLGSSLSIRGRTAPGMVRKASEKREDFGRIVHFYRAMDDEVGALIKKGVDPEKAWAEGMNTAIARVNRFKFDYSALTEFEQRVMRRGIPFYTYMRKAVPTLLESMLLNPKYLSNVNRLQMNAEGQWGEDMVFPDWLRSMGFMKLPVGENWGMTDDLLPTNVLETVTRNPVSSMNPIIQMGFEAQSGKDTFTGKPIPGDSSLERMPSILVNKYGRVPRLVNSTLDQNPDNSNMEKLLKFMGLPIRQLDAKTERAAYGEMKYNINKELDKIQKDLESKGYSVFMSNRKDGMSFRVKDKVSGETVFDGKSFKELDKFISSL